MQVVLLASDVLKDGKDSSQECELNECANSYLQLFNVKVTFVFSVSLKYHCLKLVKAMSCLEVRAL